MKSQSTKNGRRHRRAAMALSAAATFATLGGAARTFAATQFWDLNSVNAGVGNASPSGTWDNVTANWGGSAGTTATAVWGASNIAEFSAGTDAASAFTVTVSGTQDITGIIVDANEGAPTITGGGLNLTAASSFNAGTATTLTVNSPISSSGTFLLTKLGTGTLVLGSANTYSGGTSATNGTVLFGDAASFGTGLLTLGGGATIGQSGATPLTVANNITFTGNMTFGGSGAPTYSGQVSLTSNLTLTFNNPATFSGPLTIAGNITSAGTAGSIFSGATTLTGNRTITAAANAPITLSGSIGQDVAGRTLTKSGAGTLVLASANTYSGGTTVTNGTILFGDAASFGTGLLTLGGTSTIGQTGATPLTVANNITFTGNMIFGGSSTPTYSGQVSLTSTSLTLTFNNPATFSGPLTFGGNIVSAGNFGSIFSGATTLTGNRTLTTGATAPVTFSGSIGQDVSGRSFTKNGAGTVVLSTANTYDGGTSVTLGAVKFGDAASFGPATSSISFTGACSFAPTIAGLTLANPISLGDNITYAGSVACNLSGNLTLLSTNNGRGFVVSDAAGVVTFSGGLNWNTTTTLTKKGPGTLTLSLTGNTAPALLAVNEGTLNVNTASISTGITATSPSGTTILNLNTANALSGSNTLTVDQTGSTTVNMEASNNYTGATTITAGTVNADATGALGGSTVTMNGGGGVLNVTATGAFTSSPVNVNAGVLNVSASGGLGSGAVSLSAASGNATFNGNIANALSSTNSLTLTRGGSSTPTANLNFANNYSGGTTFSGGIINFSNQASLGSGTLLVHDKYNSDSTLVPSTTGFNVANPIILGTVITGTTYAGTLTVGSSVASLELSGGVTLANTGASFGGNISVTSALTGVTVSGAVTGVGALTKNGAGTLILSNASNNYTGATTASAGKLLFGSSLTTSSSMNATGGRLELAAAADPTVASNVIKTSTISASTGGKIDLQNNKGIVTTVGSFSSVNALVATGRNGGAWNGANGIGTSQADASAGRTAIATALNSDLPAPKATFGGQAVVGTDVLLMYTYDGDATMDGKIDGDDYVQIDAGFSSQIAKWVNGDFNYSGNIDADDYWIIDHNYGHQTLGVFASASSLPVGAAGMTAVPEPASIAALALAAAGTMFRRARRRSFR